VRAVRGVSPWAYLCRRVQVRKSQARSVEAHRGASARQTVREGVRARPSAATLEGRGTRGRGRAGKSQRVREAHAGARRRGRPRTILGHWPPNSLPVPWARTVRTIETCVLLRCPYLSPAPTICARYRDWRGTLVGASPSALKGPRSGSTAATRAVPTSRGRMLALALFLDLAV